MIKASYHLIIVSLVSSFLLVLLLLFYRYVFPKKSIPPFVLLLLISVLPIISVFRPGVYESGDLGLHATRAISFYEALFVNHVIPRWAAELNLGYGDAYFQFIYFLPYIIISLFHFIGFSFIASVKALIIISYIGSGITMYLFAKAQFGKKAAFVASIFYLFAPYHLVDMHFRATIAENLSFLFVPLQFYLIKHFIEKQNRKFFLLFSISTALLLLTHAVTFLASFPFTIAYGGFIYRKKKKPLWPTVFYFFLSFITSLAITSFYWIPILLESKYIYQQIFNKVITFTPFHMLLYSPYKYGFLFQGNRGELSFLIGYTQLFIVAFSVFLLFRGKIKVHKHMLIFNLISVTMLFFLIQPISEPIWHIVPLISNFQFTYRLLLILCFFISFITAIVIANYKNSTFVILLCVVTILYTILNWGNRRVIPEINDTILKQQLVYGAALTGNPEPTTPIWVDPKKISFHHKPKNHLEVISGNAIIKETYRSQIKHEYVVYVSSQTVFKENTFYFPGWEVNVNNKKHLFHYQSKQYPGLIMFKLPSGIYKVEVVFNDTPVRRFSLVISLLTWSSLVILMLFSLLRTVLKR